MSDPLNPPHYKLSKITPIDIIEEYGLNFNCGNVIKYLLRAGHKTPDGHEDLCKAAWYLQREIMRQTRELLRNPPCQNNIPNLDIPVE